MSHGRLRLALLCLLVTIAFMPGCGSDNTTSVDTGPLPSPLVSPQPTVAPTPAPSVVPGSSPVPSPSPSPVAPPIATLTVNLVLEQLRAVQAYVQTIRVSGLNAGGQRIYGPVDRPKQARLVFSDVPSNVVEIQIDFLIGDTVTGIFRGPINLTSGAATINDPNFIDVNTVQSIAVTGQSTMARGAQVQLVARGTFSDGKSYDLSTSVRWASSAPGVATVSATGEVTGVTPGSATITANRDALNGSLAVTVSPASLVSLTVSPANASIAMLATQAFTARGTFSDSTTQDLTTQVTWTSSNASVATVSNTGLASGVGPGTATIRASHGAVNGTATLVVSGPTVVNAVILPPNPSVTQFGYQSFALNATLQNGSVQNLTQFATWTSSEPSIAAVTQPGEIRALNRGTAVLTATLGSVVAQTNVTTVEPTVPGGSPPASAPRFAAGVNFPLGRAPQQMVAGNFTADALADLATANDGTNDVSVLINTGGAFGGATNFGSGGAGPFGIATGLLDPGAVLDLVTADQTGNNVSVLVGDGLGAFSIFDTGDPAAMTPQGIALGDFDGDADLDCATANNGDATVSVLLNNGTGMFGTGTTFMTGNGPFGVAVANFNGDAFLDLAVSCITTGGVTVRFGAAGATFPTFVNVTTGAGARRILARDLNADGRMDFATPNFNVDNISLVYGNGIGGFAASINVSVGDGPEEIAAGDFTGDGLLDLAVANGFSNNVSILRGNGSGTYTPAATLSATGTGTDSIVAADFNGDGRLDLAAANQSGSVTLFVQLP